MENILIYLVRSFICLGVLYIVWWLFMSKDTFFTVSRFYLTSSVFLSLLVPLVDFASFTNFGKLPTAIMMQAVTIKPEEIQNVYSNNLSFFQVIVVVYLTGVAIFTIRFLIQLFQLLGLIRKYGISKKDGLRFVFTDSNYAPFSFFGLIFLNSRFSEQDLEKIIIHESVHIKQRHSIDLLLIELLTIIQWFNPFTWFYRKSIKSIHEYLADEGVLFRGIDRFNYQELLLSLSLGIQVNDLTNNIHKSLIKRRFSVMVQEKSNLNSSLKYLLVLPAAIILLLTFGMNDSTLKTNLNFGIDSVYVNTDVEPSFPGGSKELQKFLITNIKYPKDCKEKGIQGVVKVEFVVTDKGKIEDTKVIKSVNPELDNESVRVVKLMPDWEPGQLKGKLVSTRIIIPFYYKLQ